MKGSLKVAASQLNLSLTLQSGQAFRWRNKFINDNSLWFGVIDNYALSLYQDTLHNVINYTVYNLNQTKKDDLTTGKPKRSKRFKTEQKSFGREAVEKAIHDYFQLDVCLEELYKKWSKSDDNFARIAKEFSGVRIVRQDPVENLFSFICSSNNNIQRISKMVENICYKFGNEIADVDGYGKIFAFPSIKTLAMDNVEDELRKICFGYRAKFINQSAKFIMDKHPDQPEKWLLSLRNLSYEQCHELLCELPGVGAKVADCVCLMSLNHHNAIPIDTHVWQIAARDYLPELNKQKTLSNKLYKEIGKNNKILNF